MCLPILAIRFAYWWLAAFSSNAKWNPLGGSVGLLMGMHTIPEWIMVGLVIALGHTLPPMRTSEYERNYHGTFTTSSRVKPGKYHADDDEAIFGTAV
jgi:hypothetical protein